jgi:hypothetical protein
MPIVNSGPVAEGEAALYTGQGEYVTRVKLARALDGVVLWKGRCFARKTGGQFSEVGMTTSQEAPR